MAIADRLVDFGLKYWHRWFGAVACIGVAGGTVWHISASLDVRLRALLTAGAVSAGAVIWLAVHRVPRTPKGRFGFVLSISCDNDEQEKQLRADFIDRLRDQLNASDGAGAFSLLVYPRHIAEKVDTHEVADKLMKKSRARFMVWGKVKQRLDGRGQQIHFLQLEGRVRHAATSEANQQLLKLEFSSYLPRRVVVPTQGSVFLFETASEWLELSSRYIVGIALMLSGDWVAAEQQLLRVEAKLPAVVPKASQLRAIARVLPERITSFYLAWLQSAYSDYFLTRDSQYVELLDSLAAKLLQRDPANYNGLLCQAMTDFALRRDVKSAVRLVKRCKKQRDQTWRYSAAFLAAYGGNLKRAREEYARAFRGAGADPSVPVQCEEFIQIVLNEEPEATQLHFCSALINLHAKADTAAAQRDFELFLAGTPEHSFPAERQIAKDCLAQLRTAPDSDDRGGEPVDFQLRPLAT